MCSTVRHILSAKHQVGVFVCFSVAHGAAQMKLMICASETSENSKTFIQKWETLSPFISPGLILHELQHFPSWDLRKSAATVQQSYKKHWQCYNGFISLRQAEEEEFLNPHSVAKFFSSESRPTYSKQP